MTYAPDRAVLQSIAKRSREIREGFGRKGEKSKRDSALSAAAGNSRNILEV